MPDATLKPDRSSTCVGEALVLQIISGPLLKSSWLEKRPTFLANSWHRGGMKRVGWLRILSSCANGKERVNIDGVTIVPRVVSAEAQVSRAMFAEAIGARAMAAVAVGALAIGGLAAGFIVIGRLIIRQMLVKRIQLGHLKIDQLDVRDLRVSKLTVLEEQRPGGGSESLPGGQA
jgi:hypothetical protein